MDTNNQENSGLNPKPKTSRKNLPIKKLLLFGICLILLFGIFVLGSDYIQQKNRLAERSSEIASLKDRLSRIDSSELDADESGVSEASSCTHPSSYKAAVGKFRIKLSAPKTIIRTLDAGFEGGPITDLRIGTCLSGEANVVDLYPANEVRVIGHPASSSADLKSQYEIANGVTLTPSGTVSVAGETAQRYTADYLFSATLLYFDHGGIGYQIELVDTNTVTSSILSDLIDDWVFTP